MSNEIAIVEPLSGTEVIDAVLHKVREQLMRDCFLSPNSAYEKFSATIVVTLRASDCGREVAVDKAVEVHQGPAFTEGEDVEKFVSEDHIQEAPPNVVRRETEQPLPVMSEDGSGRKEVRRVKYQKKEKPD